MNYSYHDPDPMMGGNSIIAQARKDVGYEGHSSIGVAKDGGTGVGLAWGPVAKNVNLNG